MKKIIIYMLILFFLKGLFYIFYIEYPNTLSSPDDIGHISYIVSISDTNKLPVLYDSTIEHKIEVNNNIIWDYHIMTNFIYNNKNIKYSQHSNWIVQHPPLYYLIMTPIYNVISSITNNFYNIIYGMKIISLLFGLFSLYILYRILININLSVLSQLLGLSIFVFSSAFTYFYTIINNDVLLFMLCILVWYFLILYTKTDKLRYYYAYVITFAAVIMTKYTGVLGILPSLIYLIIYMYRKYKIKRSTALLFIGAIIGIILIGPYLIRNYILLDTFFPTFEKFMDSNNKTFYNFIYNTIYFDELFRKLILYTGQRWLLIANKIMVYLTIVILFLISLQFYKKKNIYTLFVFIIIMCSLINMNIITSIGVSLYCIILYGFITEYKNKNELVFNTIVVSSILFTFIVFMYSQYNIYSFRGQLGAVQGRYYYILIFPIIYTMVKSINNIKSKVILSAIFILLIILEYNGMIYMIENWSMK